MKARSCEKAWSCLWNGEKFFVMYYMDSRVEGKTGNKGKILKGRYDILCTTAFDFMFTEGMRCFSADIWGSPEFVKGKGACTHVECNLTNDVKDCEDPKEQTNHLR